MTIKITPDQLSDSYRVIRAEACDFEALYALYRSNASYFQYFGIDPAREELRRDMTMLPEGCEREQKHFFMYRDGGEPLALLDLIEGYPDEHTCYIGLFMVHAKRSDQGAGTRIITELCAALKALGFDELRLAYGKRYLHAAHFWTKNGFVPLREAKLEKYGELIVARRDL